MTFLPVFESLRSRKRWHGIALVWAELWHAAMRSDSGTVDQLAERLDLSKTHVQKCLRVLVAMGFVHAVRTRSNSSPITLLIRAYAQSDDEAYLARVTASGVIDLDSDGSDFVRLWEDAPLQSTLLSGVVLHGIHFVKATSKSIEKCLSAFESQSSQALELQIQASESQSSKRFAPKENHYNNLNNNTRHVETSDATPAGALDSIPTETPQHDAIRAELLAELESAGRLKRAKGTGPKTPEEREFLAWVWALWLEVMGYQDRGFTLGARRTEIALARFREGRTRAQFEAVIRWAAQDDWLRGRAKGSTRPYDDFPTIFATGKFDQYLTAAATRRPRAEVNGSGSFASDRPVQTRIL